MNTAFEDLDYVVVSDALTGIVGAFETEDMARMFADRVGAVVPGTVFDVIPISQLDA